MLKLKIQFEKINLQQGKKFKILWKMFKTYERDGIIYEETKKNTYYFHVSRNY